MTLMGFETHGHRDCIAAAVAADRACAERRLQFTPVRRRVLEILLEGRRAIGAYEILDRLRAEGLGSQPPVACRALDFLTRHGFAHKIERLNAVVACADSEESHAPAFMICRGCDTVAEAQAEPARGMLDRAATAVGFRVERLAVDAEGLCPNCRGEAA